MAEIANEVAYISGIAKGNLLTYSVVYRQPPEVSTQAPQSIDMVVGIRAQSATVPRKVTEQRATVGSSLQRRDGVQLGTTTLIGFEIGKCEDFVSDQE